MFSQEEIKACLECINQLNQSDPDRKEFGSSKHQYSTKKHTSDEIRLFEEKFHVKLPEEFVQLITEIGYGAGPQYGIIGLDEMSDYPFLIRKFNKDTSEFELYYDYELDVLDECDGTEFEIRGLPIIYGGCAYFSYIMVTGQNSGNIVSVVLGEEFDILDHGIPLRENYLTWLEISLRRRRFWRSLYEDFKRRFING